MKRTLHFSSLMLLALPACARDPVVPPPAGGQSGDDGDVIGEPVPPGLPQLPCDPEETELALDERTLFGASSSEIIGRLQFTSSSFFWVPFDALPDVSFSPGPGQTVLTLELGVRTGAAATQRRWRPETDEVRCPDDAVQVPVNVTLRTSDGAFDERRDGVLQLTSARTAHLQLELEPDELSGSFGFERIGAPEEGWEATGLTVQADFWPGGSSGSVDPSFATTANLPARPPATSAAPSSILQGTDILVPEVPEQFRSLAVWPRREACESEGRGLAVARALDEPVIGWSVADVVAELEANSRWTLGSGAGATPVRFAVQAPVGLQCVRVEGRAMTFDVLATLGADGAVGSPLEQLAATSVFELRARAALDGSGLDQLRWVRRDVVAPQSRSAFQAATGIALSAPAEYERVWWSWHGIDARDGAASTWVARGELVVSSLNAQQAAEIDRVVSQGGPGAGISYDNDTQFPVLPGDTLLDAEIAP